ncbi:baseplate assembly protein [Novosphingopyxis sp. YJ-S2-01]|uniref:baseplate assembly protein n=1 Tax=Novosphingopyxis sp. YJ-S2-01 TaxID=2794021 RepID=UPI0018DD3ECD|nr:baseplate J/gp47 family protein [Novosphingopyxis sp. YJ-S2-01]MBH9537900.1 baseplate J/gp47 family protein [Novosphingopyxis sp. YJ-S2-01]
MAISGEKFDGVDLSRLPAPRVAEAVGYDAVRAAIIADIAALFPEFSSLSPADPAVKLAEYFAYRELLIRSRIDEAGLAVMPAFASGPDLDHIGALYGVERQIIIPADRARGVPAVLENDEDLRARIVRAPEAFTAAGSVGAYVSLATEADARVRRASCISPAPGEVLVTVQSRQGDGSASADLVSAVAAFLSAEERRPLTDRLTVQSAKIRPYVVTASIRTYAGPDSGLLIETARERLSAWQAANQLLGRDITLDGILAQLRVEGISRVTLHGWKDVICEETEAAFCTGIAVHAEGIGE